eukprot:3733630-Rhodomonas_salina.3
MSSDEISRAPSSLPAMSIRGSSFNWKKLPRKDRSIRQVEVLQAAKRGAINAAIDFENALRIERGKVMLDIAQRFARLLPALLGSRSSDPRQLQPGIQIILATRFRISSRRLSSLRETCPRTSACLAST